jgi:pyridoxal phosphate enzyme (YggS family)
MSQSSGHADNHKTVGDLIPAGQWGEDVFVDSQLVNRNLLDVEKKIAPCKPKIIGVTKYFGLSALVSGYEAGLRNFAESRAMDAIKKIELLPEDVRNNSQFHFIGHLQTNKAEKVVQYFDYIHSVDSLKLASVISQAACRLNKREKILLQVNVAGEEQKFGYEAEDLRADLEQILSLESVEVIGLMCMAPFGAEEVELKKIFSNLRKLRDELEREFEIKLPELSMGMSDDYEIAVAEGATMIRIGRKLFK